MATKGLLERAALAGTWDICRIRRRAGAWVIGLTQFRSAAAATNKQETGQETEQKDERQTGTVTWSAKIADLYKGQGKSCQKFTHQNLVVWYGYCYVSNVLSTVVTCTSTKSVNLF